MNCVWRANRGYRVCFPLVATPDRHRSFHMSPTPGKMADRIVSGCLRHAARHVRFVKESDKNKINCEIKYLYLLLLITQFVTNGNLLAKLITFIIFK